MKSASMKAFLVFALLRVSSSVSASLIDGLVACYPFRGNSNDQSVHGNDGIVYGAVLTNDRFGNPNSAYMFDGMDDYISIAHAASIDFAFNDFTLSLWMKSAGLVGDQQRKLIDKRVPGSGSPAGTGYNLLLDQWGHAFLALQGGTPNTDLHGFDPLDDEGWHHVVAVVDRSAGTSMLYIDGEPDAVGGTVAFSLANTGPLLIGTRYTLEDYFNGAIDDIRIYDRALAFEEVIQLKAIPEPTTLGLLGLGGLGVLRRRTAGKPSRA